MKRAMLMLAVLLTAGMWGLGLGFQQPEPKGEPEAQARVEVGPRFVAVDIFIDSGETPLGAYQVELKAAPPASQARDAKVTLVGVEGGEHVAYKSPPRYDPAALHEDQLKDRIILAAFNTGADLPKGKTRIARIQVQVEGPEPVYTVIVKAAGAPDGTKINAAASAALAGDSR